MKSFIIRSSGLICVVLVFCICSSAKTIVSESPWQTAIFWKCSGVNSGICVPIVYNWTAKIIVDYDSSYDSSIGANWITIKKIDQTTTMHGANLFNSQCNIKMSISSKGYDRWGNYYWTLYPNYNTPYLFQSTNLLAGGITYPYWRIPGPILKTNVSASSSNCASLYNSFSWNTSLY